ncbi:MULTISPECIES: hypothetical protein [Campylobacter]|uniref:hypothetical protein n=1 Tax=Campylobacter lanienae TaxID=75658 RepID=UPI003014A129
MQRAELGTGLACAGERKDICWRSPGRNGGMEQRHLPAFETGRAGKGQKLCAGYCPNQQHQKNRSERVKPKSQ